MSPIQIVLNSLKTYLPRIAEEGNYVLSHTSPSPG